MTAHIIDGRKLAQQWRQQIAQVIQQDLAHKHSAPVLAVVLIGDDPASQIYVKHKRHACDKVGIESRMIQDDSSISEQTLLNIIDQLNADQVVDGILVQLPLPKHIDVKKIIDRINPNKDVDGFHPTVLQRLRAGKQPLLRPCTPYGVMKMLAFESVELVGKCAVMVGHSIIVGQPMAAELRIAGCKVIVCDRSTIDLAAEVKKADILVVAVGKPNLIKGKWIKPGATVIDVGINRLSCGKLTGDVEFASASQYAGAITPVPGGVGPMTIAALMQNTLTAAKKRKNI